MTIKPTNFGILCVLAIVAALAFSCGSHAQSQRSFIGPSIRVPSDDVWLFTDRNGCQYLIWNGSYKGTMHPRMRPDGKQECGQK